MPSLSKQIQGISKKIDGYADKFGGKELRVGILSGHYEEARGGENYAYVAAIQEFGAPEVKIPPRPFFRPAVAEHQAEWAEIMADGATRVIAGEISEEDALETVGQQAEGDIQMQVTKVNAPALSPITVMLRGMRANNPDLKMGGKVVGEAAQRVADGKTNYGADDKPLDDSGEMKAHIKHLVVDK